MKEFFIWVFFPKRSRYIIFGLALTILGVVLIPFIIGIPIAGIGFMVLTIGILISYANKILGGKKLVGEFKKMFSRMGDFVKNIIRTPKN